MLQMSNKYTYADLSLMKHSLESKLNMKHRWVDRKPIIKQIKVIQKRMDSILESTLESLGFDFGL